MKLSKYKFDGSKKFNISKFPTSDNKDVDIAELANSGNENLNEINKLQQALYAERKAGVIFIFQAMDAAGKDGTIRAVFGCLSPHGVNEFCFKAPTNEEKAHDFYGGSGKLYHREGLSLSSIVPIMKMFLLVECINSMSRINFQTLQIQMM